MWAARVAHNYQLPVGDVYRWAHSDLVAAVASLGADAERCPGCGLSESETHWVAAELVTCPSCEDRDRQLKQLDGTKDRAGWRSKFRQLATVEESVLESSAARFTLAGARARAAFIRAMRT